MEEVHEWQTRKNWWHYHIHPYMVAQIYCGIHQRISETGIVAAILHDNIENAKKSWKVENYFTIKESFWIEDAIICEVLSKKDILNKQERNEEYFSRFKSLESLREYIKQLIEEYEWDNSPLYTSQKIRDIAFKVSIIKICDRIHNLRTMNQFKPEKIREKIDETTTYLLPLARELWESHPEILKQLLEAIRIAEVYYTSNRAQELSE